MFDSENLLLAEVQEDVLFDEDGSDKEPEYAEDDEEEETDDDMEDEEDDEEEDAEEEEEENDDDFPGDGE